MSCMLQLRKGAHQHLINGGVNYLRFYYRHQILVQHLGRDATIVQTGAARWALIHQRDLQAFVCGLGGHMRSRACADDDKVEFVHGSSKIEVVA
jgi:hypothetical protein